ncbi:MAG: hypothetical protein RIQ60_127 [Pseudomonadota bacterium]|jgi:hypothetical protein
MQVLLNTLREATATWLDGVARALRPPLAPGLMVGSDVSGVAGVHPLQAADGGLDTVALPRVLRLGAARSRRCTSVNGIQRSAQPGTPWPCAWTEPRATVIAPKPAVRDALDRRMSPRTGPAQYPGQLGTSPRQVATRARCAPDDVCLTVISGRLSEVCELLDAMVASEALQN